MLLTVISIKYVFNYSLFFLTKNNNNKFIFYYDTSIWTYLVTLAIDILIKKLLIKWERMAGLKQTMIKMLDMGLKVCNYH